MWIRTRKHKENHVHILPGAGLVRHNDNNNRKEKIISFTVHSQKMTAIYLLNNTVKNEQALDQRQLLITTLMFFV